MTRREFNEMIRCEFLMQQTMTRLTLYYRDKDYDPYHCTDKFREVPLLRNRLNYYINRYTLLYTKYRSENQKVS